MQPLVLAFFTQYVFLAIHPHYLCNNSLFFFIADWSSMVWMYHSLFNHLPAQRHLVCFQFLNKSAMNVCVQVLF